MATKKIQVSSKTTLEYEVVETYTKTFHKVKVINGSTYNYVNVMTKDKEKLEDKLANTIVSQFDSVAEEVEADRVKEKKASAKNK